MSNAEADDGRRLIIHLLGPVHVEIDGRPLAVDTRKALALLAYVSLANRATPREVLAALLWPESGEAEARSALRRTLSVLNSGLQRTGIVVDRQTVSIDRDVTELDIETFRTAIDRARAHRHAPGRPCPDCLHTLQAALDVARGPFMDGFAIRDSEPFDEWLAAERSSHERELAGALERLVSEQVAVADWRGAIRTGQRWLELDQLHEPAHRALMEAYARSGERAAAIKQYRDVAAVLERELGVVPLPETTELYEAIVASTLVDIPAGPVAPPLPDPEPDDQQVPAPPLLGRDHELEHVLGAVGAITTDGRLVAIEGEAGIGKSRLADALTEAAASAGHAVIAARCYAGEAGIALAPIVALLRARLGAQSANEPSGLPASTRRALSPLLPELFGTEPMPDGGEGRRGPTARLTLLEAITDGLTFGDTSDRAAIVRVDDIQWADDSTLEVLTFLVRRLAGRPIVLLLSWRREELDERTAPLMAELQTGSLIRLGRLGPEETRSLVKALVASGRPALTSTTVDELIVEAEGLPLYVVEALAATDRDPGAVPAGIRALLQARLAALSDIAVQVVAAAAVIGRSFDVDVLRQVSGRSDDETVVAIEELTRRGIVTEAGSDSAAIYDFVHARLRDVAYEGTSIARRRLLHRRTADAYRTIGLATEDQLGRLARIAQHEREGGRTVEAAEAFRLAGQLAGRVYANREALAYLEAAIALGHPAAAEIQLELGAVRTRVGDYPGAIAAFEMAAASAQPERLGRIEQHVGRIYLRRGDPTAADAHFAAAIAAFDEIGVSSGPDRSRVLADRAIAADRAGNPARAQALAHEAHDGAAGDPSAEMTADRILGLLARERGDTAMAKMLLERSLDTATSLDDPPATIAATNGLALVAADGGDSDTAISLSEAALAIARRTGERHLEAALENNLADALEAAGRREEAMEHLKVAARAFVDIEAPTEDREPGIWMLESW